MQELTTEWPGDSLCDSLPDSLRASQRKTNRHIAKTPLQSFAPLVSKALFKLLQPSSFRAN
jgi:hypothetical protein